MSKRHKLSLTLKISFIIFATIGLLAAESPRSIFYYTLQSNLWLVLVQLVFVVDDIFVLKNRPSFIKDWHRKVKFVSVGAVTLTMLVFGIILAPVLPLDVTFSLTSVMLHFIAPILALVDLFIFDNDLAIKNKDILYAYIPALYYLSFVATFVLLGIRFTSEQTLVPYFFLDYEVLGWFRISSAGIGVFYWMMILLAIVTMITLSLRYFLNKFKLRNNKKTEIERIS